MTDASPAAGSPSPRGRAGDRGPREGRLQRENRRDLRPGLWLAVLLWVILPPGFSSGQGSAAGAADSFPGVRQGPQSGPSAGTVPGKGVPGDGGPGDAAYGEAAPGKGVPGDGGPGDAAYGETAPGKGVPQGALPGRVVRVVDGDTVVVRLVHPPAGFAGVERVRLIGIDAPESVRPGTPVQPFAREAAAYARAALQGRRVFLAFDRELRDRYGRVLAYLYRDDGVFFNARMVEDGYAHAYTRYPFRFMEEFRALERGARREGRGLWGQAPGK